MSRKQEIAKDIQQMFGCGFVNKTQVAKYMGYSDIHKVNTLLNPLQKNGTKYFVKDVAEQIERGMR